MENEFCEVDDGGAGNFRDGMRREGRGKRTEKTLPRFARCWLRPPQRRGGRGFMLESRMTPA